MAEKCDWTEENIKKLLAAMKTGIQDQDRMVDYTKGLEALDWITVAFPPFSPLTCQQKWTEMLQKMCKIRTLTELITAAEDVLSDPVQNDMHPDPVRKPRSPSSIFYEENWAMFHKQHPEMNSQTLYRSLLEKYNELPDEEKAQYNEKYQLASEEYKRTKQDLREECDACPIQKRRTSKKRKAPTETTDDQECTEDEDALPPKPPFCGYNLFCKEQQASMNGVSRNRYVPAWARRWRDLTEHQREEYNTRCKQLKETYSRELNAYLDTLDEEKQERILKKHGIKRPKVVKNSAKEVKRLPGEPKMPCRASNSIFFKHQMALLKGKTANSNKRFKQVAQMWQELPPSEKRRYREKVCENVKKYSVELQKWFETLPEEKKSEYVQQNHRKCKYLDVAQAKSLAKKQEDCWKQRCNTSKRSADRTDHKKKIVRRTSDSEDENLEDDSTSEEDNSSDSEEQDRNDVEDEEEGGDNMFEML